MTADASPAGTSHPRRLAKSLGMAALLVGVAVALADSSIVVLALPDLLKQFDTSIESVSWVVTAYNVALACVAFVVARTALRSLDAARLAQVGGLFFFAASLACALSSGVWELVAFRSVQGAGAALFVVGALPLVRAAASTPARGTALWAGAGIFGAALGPAAGGLLTDVFSWRAIFYAQAPIAAVGLVASLRLRAVKPEAVPAALRSRRARWAEGLALALASAALVGLLFLAVLLLIDVWRLSPLAAAGVVSVIPLATLLAQPFASSRGFGLTAAGAILLAGGLAGMAFLPARNLGWVVAALAIAGAGLGLLLPTLTHRVLGAHDSPVLSGAESIWIRHAGLVAGLLIITPLLTSDLSAAGTSAKLRGISAVLDAPVPASTKLRLAIDLAPVLSRPAREGLPDVTKTLAAKHESSLTTIGHVLDRIVVATVTRAFRRSFLVAGLFALLAFVPLAVLDRSGIPSRRRFQAPAVAILVVAALVGAELARGGASFGTKPELLAPCAPRSTPATGGAGGQVQQAILSGLDRISCRLGVRREQLVANLASAGSRSGIAAEVALLAPLIGGVPDWLKELLGIGK